MAAVVFVVAFMRMTMWQLSSFKALFSEDDNVAAVIF